MRVLVTGAGGLLGGRVATLLADRGFSVTAAHRRAAPPPGLPSVFIELTEPGALEALLDREAPDAVVHSAAVARADRCLDQPSIAEEVNARLPGRLAVLCRDRGIRLVGLSTDLTLDGTRPCSSEEADARPVSLYGKTKLAGEDALLSADPSAAVVRVALVVGRGHGPGATASEGIVRALVAGRALRLFSDEYRSPVDPESVAAAIGLLLERRGSGRFHVGGPERLTRHELGLRVAGLFGLTAGSIEAALQASHAGLEPRAADASLDCTRARRELGWAPRPLDEALRESRTD